MIKLAGKMMDGTPVTLVHEDLGDIIPGVAEGGKIFWCYTSRIVSDLLGTIYVQTAKDGLEGDVEAYRTFEESLALRERGVDLRSLREVTP